MVTCKEHTPILLEAVLRFLDVRPGRKYIDATVGGGGHSEAILKAGGKILGIDQSPKSLEIAERRLLACPDRYRPVPVPGVFKLVQGNFADILKIARDYGWVPVHGVLFDLGFASFQVDDPKYGLSFSREGPLDMRLDPTLGVTAADLISGLAENELTRLFSQVGEEKFARAIARAIVCRRKVKKFTETTDLASLVEEVYRGKRAVSGFSRIHPATKVFMALRIVVNSEFENLRKGLEAAEQVLVRGGRLVVISFHSGEDRIVKNFLREEEKEGTVDILTKKPVRPSFQEIADNPRARSALLRAGEKI